MCWLTAVWYQMVPGILRQNLETEVASNLCHSIIGRPGSRFPLLFLLLSVYVSASCSVYFLHIFVVFVAFLSSVLVVPLFGCCLLLTFVKSSETEPCYYISVSTRSRSWLYASFVAFKKDVLGHCCCYWLSAWLFLQGLSRPEGSHLAVLACCWCRPLCM